MTRALCSLLAVLGNSATNTFRRCIRQLLLTVEAGLLNLTEKAASGTGEDAFCVSGWFGA